MFDKIIRRESYKIETGYYTKSGFFVLHSFDDEPSRVYIHGTQEWHNSGILIKEEHKYTKKR